MLLFDENGLDEWIRAHAETAQGVTVELVWRLVSAASPEPRERRFPLGDSIGQHGPDGVLVTDFPFEPFVPIGRSHWEVGAGVNARKKAASDYPDSIRDVPEAIRKDSTFIFVTPLSGRRDWAHTWKEGDQASWIEEKRSEGEWKDVRVIDGTKLIDWLDKFPSVMLWLAQRMGIKTDALESLEQRWDLVKGIGAPPPLLPDLFLANRDAASAKLKESLSRNSLQLQVDTRFPDQLAPFVSAFVATMADDQRVEVLGRSLIVKSPDAWRSIIGSVRQHLLIATFDVEQEEVRSDLLLERAKRLGHAVVYRGSPGGLPHPNRTSMP